MSEEYRADWAQKDFYAELGVKKDATADEVKKAYRRLARANHPDSNPGDTAKHDKFKSVAEAYDVVGDPAKRAKYDEFRSSMGSGGFRYSGGGPGFGGAGTGFNLDDLLRDRAGDVMLVSHDGDFLDDLSALIDDDRRVGLLAFSEFRNVGFASIPGLRKFDLEYDAEVFDAPLPRVRVIPIDEFDPEAFLR